MVNENDYLCRGSKKMSFNYAFAFILTFFMHSRTIYGSPSRATDNFVSFCGFLQDPLGIFSSAPSTLPPAQYWSNSSTWPGGIIPGVGAAIGANVTVPCGQVIIMDMANLTLGVLRVQGLLEFLDSPALPSIYIKLNFVVVEGQLLIGTPTQQFSQHATIELAPNPNNRLPYQFTDTLPAEPAYPRSLGHKAFAVVGGQVSLHGLPFASSVPVWCRLMQTANRSDTSITVDADVHTWPIGGTLAITSTDYDRFQTETFTIVKVVPTNGGSIITLSSPLQYMHYGQRNGLSDGFGNFVDQRAEVALLSRNIVIFGTDEPPPYQLEGGHFIIFMTNWPPQFIEGVQVLLMGQQGQLGRYPIHFHVCGNVPGTIVRKNSILQSKQRCVVVHATHNVTVDQNVAFNTSGHCFMIEEGGETDNVFTYNLGILQYAVSVLISSIETDNSPSSFWITNAQNTYVGNVGAGSSDSSFWFEFRSAVRGLSLSIPSLNTTVPVYGTLKNFTNNVAHSNGNAGIRTYPNGMFPRLGSMTVPGPVNIMDSINCYKNVFTGMFSHNTDLLVIKNSVFADNGWALYLNRNSRVTLQSSRVVGLTTNYGNPSGCDSTNAYWGSCRPGTTANCRMPVAPGVPGRSTGFVGLNAPSLGLVVDQSGVNEFAVVMEPNNVVNTTFANFDATCTNSSAIVTIGGSEFWNPSHNVQGSKFSNNSRPIWTPARYYQIDDFYNTEDGGEQSQFYAYFDKDGSILGYPGYVLANNIRILPPGMRGCKAKPSWNSFACKNVCYRTVMVAYPEPGFVDSYSNINNTRATFSYLKVTRVTDGMSFSVNGNLQENNIPGPVQRYYYVTVLAGQTYQLTVVPPPSSPKFVPDNITVTMVDAGECGQGLSLQIRQVAGSLWTIASSNQVFNKLCPGVSSLNSSLPTAYYSQACVGNKPWIQLDLSPSFRCFYFYDTVVTLIRSASSFNGECQTDSLCGLIWSGQPWLYDGSGLERHPLFYNPIIAPGQVSQWSQGSAILGYSIWTTSVNIRTVLPALSSTVQTYYYRSNFSIVNSACYSWLAIEMIVKDGAVVYLNNQEAMRVNMPAGAITNSTPATASVPYLTWQSLTLPLNSTTAYSLYDGVNTVAVEVHIGQYSSQSFFDMRIVAHRVNATCTGKVKGTEICDGVNNAGGGVDVGPDGKKLTLPCSTACGNGTQTCINGYYQNCSAPPALPEVCDGIDNNCDGLIDNGLGQLNCASGNVCFNATCLPVFNATTKQKVWPQNSSGWMYYDHGKNLDALDPTWRTDGVPTWPTGSGPLGFNYNNYTWDWLGTTINNFFSDRASLTAYFVKSFTLSAADLNSTFSLDFNVRRVDGAVIFVNGVETWRTNMNWGPVYWNTTAASQTNPSAYFPGCCNLQWVYYPCDNCRRNSSYALKVGTNYIAAELHMNHAWRTDAAFDMDLTRNAIVPCNSFPGSPARCARQVNFTLAPPNNAWKFSDASLPLPSSNWNSVGFNDSSWSTGITPFGCPTCGQKTAISMTRSDGSTSPVYFRLPLNRTDGNCFFQLSTSLLAKDGYVIYINGVELLRANLPLGAVNATTVALSEGPWSYSSPIISGGWLNAGMNIIAVELHKSASSSTFLFDFQFVGSREGILCSPDPSDAMIPL